MQARHAGFAEVGRVGESHQCSATGPKTLQSEHRLRDGGAGSGKALVYTCYYTGDLLTSLTRGRRFPTCCLSRASAVQRSASSRSASAR